MNKTKKVLVLLMALVMAASFTFILAACKPKTVQVTYYGVEVTKVPAKIATSSANVVVKEGEKAIALTLTFYANKAVEVSGSFKATGAESAEAISVEATYSASGTAEAPQITFAGANASKFSKGEVADGKIAIGFAASSIVSGGIAVEAEFSIAATAIENLVIATANSVAEKTNNIYLFESAVKGVETVEVGKAPTGICVAEDGSKYIVGEAASYTSEVVAADDEESLVAYDWSKSISADAAVYAEDTAYGYYADLATGDGHTLNYSTTVFPTTWNSHIYQTNTDALILDYSASGFYTFDYNETKDGFVWADDMAVGDPVDVSATYAGEEAGWGIEEGETARAWKVTIRDDLCWDDGTAITAEDFITSTKLLLNPFAQNNRADSYTYSGSFKIHNAKYYLRQGNAFDEQISGWYSTIAEAKAAGYAPHLDKEAIVAGFSAWGVSTTYAKIVSAYSPAYFTIYTTVDGERVSTGENFFSKYKIGDDVAYIDLTDAMYADYANCDDWNPDPESELALLCSIPVVYPECSWDTVGIKKISDTEIVFIIDSPLEGFYLKYAMGTWLVKENVYLANSNLVKNAAGDYVLKEGETVYSTTYCTTAANSPSYGAYKLAEYQVDKYFKLVKNENWWGYDDAANEGLYQTDAIRYVMVESAATRLQMFLAGQLDTYGLSSDDMDEYQTSDYTYYTDGDSTWFIALNPDLDALTAAEYETTTNEQGETVQGAHKNIDKQIITIKEFRQALCYALDRAAYELACDPTGNPAKALFSPMIICNPEEGIAYRTTAEAKQAVVEFWGIADQIGAGKLYATIDEAIESISGYNLAMAKTLFDTAYDEAVAQGYIDNDDVVEIIIGTPNLTTGYYNKGYDFLVNCYTDAVKGTKLEGRLRFTRDGTLGNSFSSYLKTNKVDMLFGVGWTGSALDPYGLMDAYCYPNNQYDPGWKTAATSLTISLPMNQVEGGTDTTVIEYTASVLAWSQSLNGNTVTLYKPGATADDKPVEVKASFGSDKEYAPRLVILAKLEGAVLNQYDMIPIAYDSSAALKGKKIIYYTEEYIYGVGRGGIKYMSFAYTDAQWAKYVADQGGKLNYKATAD